MEGEKRTSVAEGWRRLGGGGRKEKKKTDPTDEVRVGEVVKGQDGGRVYVVQGAVGAN